MEEVVAKAKIKKVIMLGKNLQIIFVFSWKKCLWHKQDQYPGIQIFNIGYILI